jgi:hypothetical protein
MEQTIAVDSINIAAKKKPMQIHASKKFGGLAFQSRDYSARMEVRLVSPVLFVITFLLIKKLSSAFFGTYAQDFSRLLEATAKVRTSCFVRRFSSVFI